METSIEGATSIILPFVVYIFIDVAMVGPFLRINEYLSKVTFVLIFMQRNGSKHSSGLWLVLFFFFYELVSCASIINCPHDQNSCT